MSKIKDLTGMKFGRLTVIKRAEDYIRPNKQHQVQWHCICECGNEIDTVGYSLTHGLCTSCGCARTERVVAMNYTHGESESTLYRKWQHIKDRCLNPNDKRYDSYGGRGIKICAEWLNSFESFYEWSIKNGWKEELTIDRIDVNGNYEPSNCRWATMKEQSNNRRNNIYIEFNGKTQTLMQWCEELNLDYKKAYNRYKHLHWNIDKVFGGKK